jgi:hypothetical protein
MTSDEDFRQREISAPLQQYFAHFDARGKKKLDPGLKTKGPSGSQSQRKDPLPCKYERQHNSRIGSRNNFLSNICP